MTDEKKTTPELEPSAANDVAPLKLSRRKIAYVAPALLSRAMFYGAAGCGKSDPIIFTCQVAARGSS